MVEDLRGVLDGERMSKGLWVFHVSTELQGHKGRKGTGYFMIYYLGGDLGG